MELEAENWPLCSTSVVRGGVISVGAESALAAVSHLSLLIYLSLRAGLAQLILLVFGCISAGQDIQLLVNTPLIIRHSS